MHSKNRTFGVDAQFHLPISALQLHEVVFAGRGLYVLYVVDLERRPLRSGNGLYDRLRKFMTADIPLGTDPRVAAVEADLFSRFSCQISTSSKPSS